MVCSSSSIALFILTSLLNKSTLAEIRPFNSIIEADSTSIHYSEGFIAAPGFVDLSKLTFTTIDKSSGGIYNEGTRIPPKEDPEDDRSMKDDDMINPGDLDQNPNKQGDEAGGGGGGRHLDEAMSSPTMDIVLFQEPASCSNTPSGCDWTTLGIGAKDSEGDLRWCCSQEAIDFGFCSSEKGHLGRLIVNTTLFRGEHRFIMFPTTGIMDLKVHYPQLEIPKFSGKYALVIANCNDDGRDILITGEYSWESAHGYLPGDLFGEMYFFYFLASLYFILSLWYGVNMKIYEDAIIPLQKWILGTILLGLLETFFRSGDYFIWNEDGTRFASAMYLGVIIGVFKRGLSRCLILMVSLGWGVVRDKLDQLMCIVVLGVLYMISAGVRDVMTVVAVVENETLSIHQEVELFDFVTVVTFIVAAIDVTFYMWILDALGSTMVYLETMNQRVKLSRYLRLRFILLLSVLFAVMWSVFTMVNSNMETTMLTEDQMWAVGALMEINYLVILITVAILWRPNENAKDLAYVMELPSLGRGDDDNGLELTSNVPSALDDDDDDEEEEGNFQDEPSSDVKSDKQRFA